MIKKTLIFLVIFPLLILSGCASVRGVKNETSEEALKRRVTEYWNHRIAEELDKCYGYEYPLLRKQKTLVQYLKRYKTNTLKWRSFSIEGITIHDDANADVDLKLRVWVKLPGVPPHERDSKIIDRWVKISGIWYHVFK